MGLRSAENLAECGAGADSQLDLLDDDASLQQPFDKLSLWTYKTFCFDNLLYFGGNSASIDFLLTLSKGLLVAYEL